MSGVRTWKAEEAVPKTKPLGKLWRFISDVHIRIWTNAIIANIKAAPPLEAMFRERRLSCGREEKGEKGVLEIEAFGRIYIEREILGRRLVN